MARMQSPERATTVSAKITGSRLDQLEEYCEDRGCAKSEVIRKGIDAVTGEPEKISGRVPPTEDDLATAWKALLRLTNGGGWVKQDRCLSYLAQRVPDYNKSTVYGGLLRPLSQRGYIRLAGDYEGLTQAVYVHE